MPGYLFLLAVLVPCHSLTVTVVSYIRWLILKNDFSMKPLLILIYFIYISGGGGGFWWFSGLCAFWISGFCEFLSAQYLNFCLIAILHLLWLCKKILVVALLFPYSPPWSESLVDSCRAWEGILILTWGSPWSCKLLIAWLYLAPTKWPKIDVNYSVSLLPSGSL